MCKNGLENDPEILLSSRKSVGKILNDFGNKFCCVALSKITFPLKPMAMLLWMSVAIR